MSIRNPKRNPVSRIENGILRRVLTEVSPISVSPQVGVTSTNRVGHNEDSGEHPFYSCGMIGITPLEDFRLC